MISRILLMPVLIGHHWRGCGKCLSRIWSRRWGKCDARFLGVVWRGQGFWGPRAEPVSWNENEGAEPNQEKQSHENADRYRNSRFHFQPARIIGGLRSCPSTAFDPAMQIKR